jgi:purine-nucleoside phosphorylase
MSADGVGSSADSVRGDVIDSGADAVEAAADWVRREAGDGPRPLVIISGSGMKRLASIMQIEREIAWERIPGMPQPTVPGHGARVLLGRIGSMNALLLTGRVHFYEGQPHGQVVFAVRMAARLGGRYLLLTNAAGGVNPSFQPGDLVLIRDHLKIGLPGRLFTRPPDFREHAVTRPEGKSCSEFTLQCDRASGIHCINVFYDHTLYTLLQHAAAREKIILQQGVYAGNLGPAYETKAEAALLRECGADAVGMSTLAEVMAARQSGFRIAAVSCITNRVPAWGIERELSHADVIQRADAAVERLGRLIVRWTEDLCDAEGR